MNSHQLSFDLPVIPALGRDDFMIAQSNAMAVAMIEATQGWVNHKLILSGPEGAGKTHLAHVWAGTRKGRIINAIDLITADLPALSQMPIAIEDIPKIANNQAAQTALFHLHNLMQNTKQPLLLTGTGAPNHWKLRLADLQSRIDATGIARLAPPDDTLLGAVMAKQFNDRQLVPPPDVIPYLILRIDRSFAAARDVVKALDRHSLAQHKPLTRALAAQVLDNLG